MNQYLKTLEMYRSLEGPYPRTTRENNGEHIAMTCLWVGYPDRYCGVVTGADVYEDDAFNSELSRVVGNGAAISMNMRTLVLDRELGSEFYVGATYGVDYIGLGPVGRGSGEIYARTIQYALEGHVDCGVSSAIAWHRTNNPDVTGCIIILEDMPNYRS